MRKTIVKIVAVRENPDVPCWPCINHDADKELERVTAPIREINPDMDFDVVSYTELAQAQADYEADLKKYDGVLVLLMTCWKFIDVFYSHQAAEGLPTIIADVPFCGSGSALVFSANVIRSEKLPVPLLSTLDYGEIAKAVRLFDVLHKMRETTILTVSGMDLTDGEKSFSQTWGCKFINKTASDLNIYYNAADTAQAEAIARRWTEETTQTLEPSMEEIIQSARLHLAIKAMMSDTHANAVTIDCLSLSYGGEYAGGKHMYPCLSHYEMLNNGIVAVCEADLCATVTSLVIQYLTGRPGFVSDPVIDTSSDQIIYAHCVACSKVYGKNDPRRCRCYIRSHAEDKQGASVQVYFPAGEKLTTAMIYPKEQADTVIHSSESVGNVGLEEACRSKLAARANAENILYNWNAGWHRGTVFGDCRKQLMNLFKMKGLKVIQEDKEPVI
ncbi:MAG: hypothetical protein KH317_06175 [Clostridiales bacterium]|nr:hypothetical protein [Clostridiales bacterium]